jgi:hypothetical protein
MGDDSSSLGLEKSEGTFAGEAPKKRTSSFVHWQRPKSQLYEYNYDYGSNYYRPMIDYLDERAQGRHPEAPKPMFWEERALKSYIDRNHRTSSMKITRDAQLLQSIRSASSRYITHTKTYARKVTTGY